MATEPTAPAPPPNLRVATDENEECAVCKFFVRGKCDKYSNLPVDDEWVCDSFSRGSESDTDDASPPPRTLKGAHAKARAILRDAQQK